MQYKYKNPDAREIAGAYALYSMLGSYFRKAWVVTPYAEQTALLYYNELARGTKSGKPNYEPLQILDEQCERALRRDFFRYIPEKSLADQDAEVSFLPRGRGYSLRFRTNRHRIYTVTYYAGEKRCEMGE